LNRNILSASVLFLALAAPAWAQRVNEANRTDPNQPTIRCESNNGRRTHCTADTRGGVQLTRTLSRSACTQGTSWGYDRRGIWVDRGCRADFALTAYSYSNYSGSAAKTVASGTNVTVRTNETIDARNNDGLIYTGSVLEAVLDQNGAVAIPQGSAAELIFRGTEDGYLVLDLESVTINGVRYAVSVDPTQTEEATREREGLGANKRTAGYVGGGALLGTIIGAIAGGGKGAAIGAAAGAGAGAAGQVLTRGKRVRIPAESAITFRLDEPLYIGIADNGYSRNRRHYHYPETIFPQR
jgi:outer membrane lipoprotein SlyB